MADTKGQKGWIVTLVGYVLGAGIAVATTIRRSKRSKGGARGAKGGMHGHGHGGGGHGHGGGAAAAGEKEGGDGHGHGAKIKAKKKIHDLSRVGSVGIKLEGNLDNIKVS